MKEIKFEVCYHNENFYLEMEDYCKEDNYYLVKVEEDYPILLGGLVLLKDVSIYTLSYDLKGFLCLSVQCSDLFLEVSGLELEDPSKKSLDYFFDKEESLMNIFTDSYLFFFNNFLNTLVIKDSIYLDMNLFKFVFFYDQFSTPPFDIIMSKDSSASSLANNYLNLESLNFYSSSLYYGSSDLLSLMSVEEGSKLFFVKVSGFYLKAFGDLSSNSFLSIFKSSSLVKGVVLLMQSFYYYSFNSLELMLNGLCLGNFHTNFSVECFGSGFAKPLEAYYPAELKAKGIIMGEVYTDFVYESVLLDNYKSLGVSEDLDLYSEMEEWAPNMPLSMKDMSLGYEEVLNMEDDLSDGVMMEQLDGKKVSKSLWKITKTVMDLESKTMEIQE